MKKKILIMGISLVLVILIALSVYFIFIKNDKTDQELFASEYTKLTSDNVFVYRGADEIINILEKGSGIVYLGFPECPWCQYYVTLLNEVAKEEGITKIYYYNILDDRKNNSESYQKIVSILKTHLDLDEEGLERIFVPDVTFVLKGEIIGHDNETSMISEDITPEEYWTDTKKSELKEKLRSYIIEVQQNLCTTCDE